MSEIPLIYVGNRVEPPLRPLARVLFGLVSVGCFAVLITAARLHPDASGMNTHRQLGMAECGFLARTGYPCMTCGMTTSFTYLAHGQVLNSLWAQPAGTIFALTAAVVAWATLYAALTGRPSARLINRMPITGAMLTLLAIGIAGWAYKIGLVLHAARHT